MLFRTRSTHVLFRGKSVVQKLSGVVSPRSSLSIVSPVFFSSLELHSVFQPESWGFCCSILPHSLGIRQQVNRKKESDGDLPHLFRTTASPTGEEGSLPLEF